MSGRDSTARTAEHDLCRAWLHGTGQMKPPHGMLCQNKINLDSQETGQPDRGRHRGRRGPQHFV